MKNPCPVCAEHPVVYQDAETCSYRCWLVFRGIHKEEPMGDQINLFPGEQTNMSDQTADKKKPRVTGKVKRESLTAISSLIAFRMKHDEDYEPPESLLKLTEALQFDLNKKR